MEPVYKKTAAFQHDHGISASDPGRADDLPGDERDPENRPSSPRRSRSST